MIYDPETALGYLADLTVLADEAKTPADREMFLSAITECLEEYDQGLI